MKMNITSGKFGGRILKTPKGTITHPMSGRTRGSLFNIINNELEGAEVLDAFAGTGSLGLEALGHGALHAMFVERDNQALDALKENINALDVKTSTTIFSMSVKNFIESNKSKVFDVIFVDPPYDDFQLSTVLQLLSLLKPNGLMILSYPGRGEVPIADKFVVVDNRSYGGSALAFYRRR